MTVTTTKLMTAEEFFDWVHRPENRGRHFELIGGQLVEVGEPGDPQALVSLNVGIVLSTYARLRRRGQPGRQTGLVVGRNPDSVLYPDVVFWDQLDRPGNPNQHPAQVTPALVVEILSAAKRGTKALKRLIRFINAGTPLGWLIDPEDRSIVVLRRDRYPELFDGEDKLAVEDVLPGFRCPVAVFFTGPRNAPEPPPASSG